MMNCSFEKGEELYYNGNYKESFEVFKAILNDSKITLIKKSDVFNMLGVLLSIEPSLSINNEFKESLSYFKKAIELNPNNLGALLNIVEGFGKSFDQHENIKLFKLVYDKLTELSNELSNSDKKMIELKYRLYLKYKNNNIKF